MSIAKSFSKITTDDTLLENKQHGDTAFPFQYYYEDIWKFEFHCIDRLALASGTRDCLCSNRSDEVLHRR